MNKKNYGTFLINILLSKRLDATKASLRITFSCNCPSFDATGAVVKRCSVKKVF